MLQVNDLVMVRIPQHNTEEYLKYCKYNSRLALERLAVVVKIPKIGSKCVVKLLGLKKRDEKPLKIPIAYIYSMKNEKIKED